VPRCERQRSRPVPFAPDQAKNVSGHQTYRMRSSGDRERPIWKEKDYNGIRQPRRANHGVMTTRRRRRGQDGLPATARRRDEDTSTTARRTIFPGPTRTRECSRFDCRSQKWELMGMHQRDVAGVLGGPRVCRFEISDRKDTSGRIIPEISIDDQVRDDLAVAPITSTTISRTTGACSNHST